METITVYLPVDPKSRHETITTLLSQGYSLSPTNDKNIIEAKKDSVLESKHERMMLLD